MEDTNTTLPMGEQPDRVTDQSSSSQLIPNETTTRAGERTCTQKLTIPSLEKHDSSSANLWWRKFVQYIKMTKDIDLSQMVNPKEILPQFRDQLELEIKDTFLWAIGQSALSEMTKTVREREPSTLPLHRLYSLFRLHFTPERNVQHSRADFFRFEKRIKRNGRRRLEENTGGGKKLRVRNHYGSRTFGLKILIAHREIHRRLRIKKEN